jgi:hypothetical protein
MPAALDEEGEHLRELPVEVDLLGRRPAIGT